MVITDLEGIVLYANPAFIKLWGYDDHKAPIGESLKDFLGESQPGEVLSGTTNEESWAGELKLVNRLGDRMELNLSSSTIEKEGNEVACTVSFTDNTDIKEKAKTVHKQAEQLLESSTPILEVWEGVLAAPLIGQLDTERTQRFMERLLEEIVETQSKVALIDITGVPDVDTRTAQHLIETVNSVKLLGADVVLTGVSPSIAQSVVHLGIDLSDIETKTTLAEGLKHIFKRETPWETTKDR